MGKSTAKLLKNYSFLTFQIAEKHGISKYKFYKFIRENNWNRIMRGIYMPQDEWKDELYVLHQRCPNAVFRTMRLFIITIFLTENPSFIP